MPGENLSLLDLFFSNKPELIDGVKNFMNITSEHEGVLINLHTDKPKSQVQFEDIRS